MDTERIIDHSVRVTVEERIAELWRWRQWTRRQPNAAFWSPLRIEYETELRVLVRLLRAARKASRTAVERADPISAAKASEDAYHRLGYHQWQAS